MCDADRRKWDARYARSDFRASAEASLFLRAQSSRIKPGTALELACGAGRNAIYLARQGFSVDAIDISEHGLQHARAGAERAGGAPKDPAAVWRRMVHSKVGLFNGPPDPHLWADVQKS